MLNQSEVCGYARVADLPRARAFYEDVLRMHPAWESEAGVLYECGRGSKFFMHCVAGVAVTAAGMLFFEVADIGMVIAKLTARGVTFERGEHPVVKQLADVLSGGAGAKVAWLKDPDGNTLALLQTA